MLGALDEYQALPGFFTFLQTRIDSYWYRKLHGFCRAKIIVAQKN